MLLTGWLASYDGKRLLACADPSDGGRLITLVELCAALLVSWTRHTALRDELTNRPPSVKQAVARCTEAMLAIFVPVLAGRAANGAVDDTRERLLAALTSCLVRLAPRCQPTCCLVRPHIDTVLHMSMFLRKARHKYFPSCDVAAHLGRAMLRLFSS
jgi:hypothetical protein